MTRRLLLLILLFYALMFLGLASRKGALIALAIPLVIYLAAALFHIPEKPALSVHRTLSMETVTQGTTVTVTLEITNLGKNIEELLLEDVFPTGVEKVEGDTRAVGSLLPGKSIDIEYAIKAVRGSYHFNDVEVTVSDFLGLVESKVTLGAEAHLLVLPEVKKLHSIPVLPLRTHGFSGPIHSRKVGAGVNFLGIREYQVGDPLRWINWRVSARHMETLYSTEFEMERIADINIILDARQESNLETDDGNLFEYAVHAAACLADTFLADGNRVGLLIYGRGIETMFPGYGKIQRQRILQLLGRARTGSTYAFTSLENLPPRFFPAGSQIVLVSPLDREDIPVLVQLQAQGYEMFVVSPDSISFEARLHEGEIAFDLAARLAKVEREILIRNLTRVGIQVVNWDIRNSLDNALHYSIGRLAKRRQLLKIS